MLLFFAMIVAPVTFYLYLAHPDWAWLYLVDSARVPRLAVVPVLAAQGAALLGGYYGAAKLVRAGKEPVLRYGVLALLCVIPILMLILRARLTQYGTFAQFHGGRALPILDVKLGYVLIALVIGVGAAAGVVAYELVRDGKRAAAR